MSKIIAVYSVVQGSGAKFLSTNLAYSFSKRYPDAKIALVDFDFRFPYLASAIAPKDEAHGIDNLIDKIDGGFLDRILFEENMIKVKNGISLLKGTKLQNNYSLIKKEHIETTIALLKEVYDYIFIVANSEFDTSASIFSCINADEIVLVGQPNYSTYLALDKVCRRVNHYAKSSCRRWFAFNFYFDSKNVDLKQSIKNNNLEVLGLVPFNEEWVDNFNLKENYMNMKNVINIKNSNSRESVSPFDLMVNKLSL